MTPVRTYVLATRRTDRWGRARWKYVQTIETAAIGIHLTGWVRCAHHFLSEDVAKETLEYSIDPEDFEVVHVPVQLYPWSLDIGS